MKTQPYALGACLLFSLNFMWAQVESSVQASARPFGLNPVGPVQLAGSDADSAAFQSQYLPSITTYLNQNLSERTNFVDADQFTLDPTKLTMATASDVRVYFLGEGAGYRNTLGFNTLSPGQATPSEIVTDTGQLIFPDASSPVSSYDPESTAQRSSRAPLLPGDFVDMGQFQSGETLDFFLVANGANGGTVSYAAPSSRNPDGLDHVVSFALEDSPYLIIGFEDLYGGGDKDYNDVLFAVDIGVANVQALVGTPEPGMLFMLGGMLGVAYLTSRRKLQVSA